MGCVSAALAGLSRSGAVWFKQELSCPAPARLRSSPHKAEDTHGHQTERLGTDAGAAVTFEPGARTAWHTHPLGQTLHVISGVGRGQAKGGPIREIKAGDTVWIPPNEKHWHGAAPTSGMVHIAMQEALDGKHVEWMEYVTDEEYGKLVG